MIQNSIPAHIQTGVISAGQEMDGTELINQYGIHYLYHMTHIDNLGSILEYGLLSHKKAHKHCILTDISDLDVNARRSIADPIYNRSIHKYVPSYFTPLNPMSYKRRELADEIVILKLNPGLLLQQGMIFTDGNAACSRTSFFNQLSDLDQLDWDCLNSSYWAGFDDGRRLRCAEVLIPNRVSTKDILQVSVKTSKGLKSVLDLMSKDIQVGMQPELFF